MLSRRNFLKASGAGAGTVAAMSVLPTVAYAEGSDDASDDSSDMSDFLASMPGNGKTNSDECYQEGVDVSTQILEEGSVLLKNADSVLPLASGTKVTILGAMSYNYVIGGTGSAGGLDDEYTVMMDDALTQAGLDVNEEGWAWLESLEGGERAVSDTDPADAVGDWTSYQSIHEYDKATYEDGAGSLTAEGYTDYAIVTFSRSGAEGASPSMDYDGDGSTLTGTTYFQLSDDEEDLLAFCKENYTHTIVIINSAATMELGFIDDDNYNIDACLWIGHPGEAGLYGVANVLAGLANPSGRTVDTYAYDQSTNPTYYNTDDNTYTNATITWGQVGMDGEPTAQAFYQYEEGIYVGYRYYETADSVGYFDSSDFTNHEFKNGKEAGYDEVVQFPFGYGLSYTDFSEEISSSDIALEPGGTNTVTVTVTNTGSVAGKDVVELYLDAPYQTDTENFGIKGVGLEKAKVVLVAFAKTDEIAAGGTADVTLTFQTDDLASYDCFGQGCYVLEAGDYKFNVQKDAHQWGDEGSDNEPSATVSVTLASSVIYEDTGDVSDATYVGARDSDAQVAVNALNDVTAGDGNMLDGYLSRSDIAAGMEQIMTHSSDEDPNEEISAAGKAALECEGTDSVEYSYETYIKGVKTTLTETLYAFGSDMMPFADATPDGTSVTDMAFPEWDQTYYVDETASGDLPTISKEEPSGAHHKLTIDDMANVPINSAEGMAIWDALACETSIDEAIEIQGNSGWKVSEVESVDKPKITVADGPGEAANGNMTMGTWWPCAVTQCSTWNTDLPRSYGEAYGAQAILTGEGGAYAPAMNLHRSPFGGRNFEYWSEDGFISGKMAGNAAAGIMSTGIVVFPKHCCMNDGDTNRNGNTAWASEQSIRELYLRPFEIAIKEFHANGIMGSLNRIGLTWYHYGMYVTIMRNEWAWGGLLITDGDGNDGNVFNSPVAMLCVQGAILNNGAYLDNSSTLAAYGDATEYAYGQQCLHDVIRYALYQYGTRNGQTIAETSDADFNAGGSTSETDTATSSTASSGGSSPVIPIVGGIAAVAVAAGVFFGLRKKGKKPAQAAEGTKEGAASDESEDTEDFE